MPHVRPNLCQYNGHYSNCGQDEICCTELGCFPDDQSGTCCGPNFYFLVRVYTEYCASNTFCCSNSISATCCAIDEICCTIADTVGCCTTAHSDSFYATSEWYLWALFSMMLISTICVFIFVCCGDDHEGHGATLRQARRLSDWYIQRSRRQDQDEVIMLSDPSIQNNNPPLYQTVVPPTYQYQKPPTPHEPPPKYESWPTEQTEAVEGAGEAAGEVESYQNSPLAPTDQQPEYVRSGKVKMNRSSPLASQIRNLVGHKLVDNGHNIFIRKNMAQNQEEHVSSGEEEEIVFELDAQPMQSH